MMEEELKSIQEFENFSEKTLNLPPESLVEMIDKILSIDVFFEEFTKEIGLGFLDREELFAVRQFFINYREALVFEKAYSVDLTNSRITLIHAAYTYITSSPSFKGKKLDTIVSRIYRMVRDDNKNQGMFFRKGDGE